jgi:adhesin transport system outer membrane protein
LSSITSAKAAESRRVAALESLIAIDRQISATVSTASAELEALRSQLDPARRQLQGINEVVESYLRQYQIGRKTWLDVLNVQREKISALAALADVEYAVEIAKVKLLTQTGHINAGTVLNIHD